MITLRITPQTKYHVIFYTLMGWRHIGDLYSDDLDEIKGLLSFSAHFELRERQRGQWRVLPLPETEQPCRIKISNRR